MPEFGRILVTMGIVLLVVGGLLTLAGRLPFNLLRLPGDIYIRREGFSFFFPITTSIVVSIILSLFLYIVRRLGG